MEGVLEDRHGPCGPCLPEPCTAHWDLDIPCFLLMTDVMSPGMDGPKYREPCRVLPGTGLEGCALGFLSREGGSQTLQGGGEREGSGEKSRPDQGKR